MDFWLVCITGISLLQIRMKYQGMSGRKGESFLCVRVIITLPCVHYICYNVSVSILFLSNLIKLYLKTFEKKMNKNGRNIRKNVFLICKPPDSIFKLGWIPKNQLLFFKLLQQLSFFFNF